MANKQKIQNPEKETPHKTRKNFIRKRITDLGELSA